MNIYLLIAHIFLLIILQYVKFGNIDENWSKIFVLYQDRRFIILFIGRSLQTGSSVGIYIL